MIVLGIESSCDETAAAIVSDDRRILANVVLSQIDEHSPYGGVVPELAARDHIRTLLPLVDSLLGDVPAEDPPVDAVAWTAGERGSSRRA